MLFIIYVVILTLAVIFYKKQTNFNFKIEPFFSIIQKRNRVFSYQIGEIFLKEVSRFEAFIAIGKMDQNLNFIQYKFYTDLVLNLIELSKKKGTKLKKHLIPVIEHIKSDIVFEKKVFEEKMSGLTQFFLVTLTTWLFIITSSRMIEFQISFFIYFLILFLQIFGLFFFLFTSNLLQKKIFQAYGKMLHEIHLFLSLIEVGIPINLVLTESNIMSGELAKNVNVEDEFQYLLEAINRLKINGISPLSDGQIVLERIKAQMEIKFQKFNRTLNFSKFLHLTLIFLPAYFLYLASIFKFFMEQ